MDILKDQWTAGLSISKAFIGIISLMKAPNPDDPLVPEIAQIYKSNHQRFEANAKQWTK
jgi:ubiquitin-conjugating enzyme E2 D/E